MHNNEEWWKGPNYLYEEIEQRLLDQSVEKDIPSGKEEQEHELEFSCEQHQLGKIPGTEHLRDASSRGYNEGNSLENVLTKTMNVSSLYKNDDRHMVKNELTHDRIIQPRQLEDNLKICPYLKDELKTF